MQQQLDQLRQAIARDPTDPGLHYELGNLLLASGQATEAMASYHTALLLAPGHPQLLLQLGNACSDLGNHQEAVTHFQQSLLGDASNPAAHFNLGNAWRELGQAEQAASSYRQALKLDPGDADALNNLGNTLRETGHLDQAITCYRDALRLNPLLHHARAHCVHQSQHICDWTDLNQEIDEIRHLVREVPSAQISPFAFLSLPGTTAAEQRRCSDNWATNRFARLIQAERRLNFQFSRSSKPRLRIGYLSGDFRLHPLAFLITEMLELHDRSQFEIHAYSYGLDDETAVGRRLAGAFDHFINIRPLSLMDAARRIHGDGIDILVDLTGYTQTSRSGILALRPAPIQVNWLGFPGTMGATFADYLISDRVITPPEEAQHYSEQLVYLPGTYQPNDRLRPIADTPEREACDLPAYSFVFCCFNQSFKITAQIFEIWMNLLSKIPNSVLWLLDCNPWAKENLRREATERHIDPRRLIFAPRVPVEQHLARQKLADLFLDTLPYNAHTTASDALWAGLPVLTCRGETFASRVAASLLEAAGLPELITGTLQEYEARALHLATHPHELKSIRQRMDCDHMPLFDTRRFTQGLEQAYREMWERWIA